MLPLTDALSLRQRADACLLVVRADTTPRDAVDQAVNLVGKEHILGIVLNGVEGLHRLYSKYGYYRSQFFPADRVVGLPPAMTGSAQRSGTARHGYFILLAAAALALFRTPVTALANLALQDEQ